MKLACDKIRWLIDRDISQVLAIENVSFSEPWGEQDFRGWLTNQYVVGMVAEWNSRVRGFMLYRVSSTLLHIMNFAVEPKFRRFGVGSQMMAKLVESLKRQRRKEITMLIPEHALDAQLFLRSQGFRMVDKVLDADDGDVYVMQFLAGSVSVEEVLCEAQ